MSGSQRDPNAAPHTLNIIIATGRPGSIYPTMSSVTTLATHLSTPAYWAESRQHLLQSDLPIGDSLNHANGHQIHLHVQASAVLFLKASKTTYAGNQQRNK